jgi:hypothetical protein
MFRAIMIASLLAAAPALAEEQVTLKPGPELDTVTATCSTCHTLNYIRMNSPFLSPDAWKAEVTKMQKTFGGPFDDETAAAIVKYLTTNYGAPPKP